MGCMSEPRDAPPRMPGWVKWPGLVLAVLILLLVVARILGVEHGPGMHTPKAPTGTAAPGGSHP